MIKRPAFLFSLAALAPLMILNFFVRLTEIPVRIWDEARNANNALEMYLHGHWMVPYYQGSPDMWNTKPPLLIWLQAGGVHLFGTGELALRLPSALAASATVLLLWRWLGDRWKRPWAGFLAGAVLCTSYAYVDNHAGRTGDYDALMVLFMTGSALSLFNWTEDGQRKWLVISWVCLALAVMTKSVAGLTLAPGLLVFILVRRKLIPILRQPFFWIGVTVFILVTGGYYFLREQYNPGYLKAVYENELGGRYLRTLEGHQYPFSFYFDNLRTWRFSYWFYFIAPAFVVGFFQSSVLIKRITLFNLLMAVPFWLIISLGGTKLDWYDLPLYPFLSLQVGILLYITWMWISQRRQQKARGLPLLAVLLIIAVFFYPLRGNMKRVYQFREKLWDEEPERQAYFLQSAIRQKTNLDAYTFCYSDYNGQIYYYINRLQAKQSGVRLFSDVNGLEPGRIVVVSQPALEEELARKYILKKLDEKSGCSVYLVQSRL